MADEDEIDILGDFSFNSCFALNNQGIPSCSNREDTVHPQWLMDSTANNWYDIQAKNMKREKDGHTKKISSKMKDEIEENVGTDIYTTWNQNERAMLIAEMAKYGRNVRKISETIKTKSEAEIQALIEAEYGINLDTPTFGLDKHEDHDDVPAVVQEEIVTDDTSVIGAFHITSRKPFRKKTYTKSKNSLIKPDILKANIKPDLIAINPSEIVYEDDLIIGSTESIGSDLDSTDIVSKNILKQQKAKGKKIGNHRRKVSKNYDKAPRNRSKDLLKSPQERQRKDSSVSEDSTKSPKMQIVLGSGQALPVSEGEQVIKIEKKKDSEPESDIDVDSDKETTSCEKKKEVALKPVSDDVPIAVPLRNFEPMPRRQKKINLDGGGGYTIMHTAAGDLLSRADEPRKPRAPRKQPVHLIPCRMYNAENPAPFTVRLHVSALISADAHAHTSRSEVMGLLGGACGPGRLLVAAYRPAAAAAGGTHCDMDPVSQAAAAESLVSLGARPLGWHHSHPRFPAQPSAQDLRSQRHVQRALPPGLALLTSPHWLPGRHASTYRCFRVEDAEDPDALPIGYQLSVSLEPDLTEENVAAFCAELAAMLCDAAPAPGHMAAICPDANMSHLDKCISSVSHHLRAAGYDAHAPVARRVLHALRHVLG
ncbi:uncharacterized protein LOC135074859 [Ostrinia nubilalis]|uniref:uncharacterized protein LOC135074859 n=1 Tax=Ostrinia nubilalis TaxID=29057 RepID=UPI0030826164